MIITPAHVAMEKHMVVYLDRIAKRISRPSPKLDYVLLIDGYEGYGKSNFACTVGAYIAEQTGRSFSNKNVFFDPEEMLKFATTTEKQIVWWDEMAFSALAMDRTDKWQLPLIQTLFTARKKRHMFIFCVPRFYRLKESIIERCMGLVHVYARNQTQLGRFFYYKRHGLEKLYEDWKKLKRKPNYSMYVTVRGTFGESLKYLIDEDGYEKKKDDAIASIVQRMRDKKVTKLDNRYKQRLAEIARYAILHKIVDDLANYIEVTPTAIYKWKDYNPKAKKPLPA